MSIQAYLNAISVRYKTGISREHTYRGDLQSLLMEILPDILVTNEPARVACGAPDYVLTRKDIPIGYIEAKDIGVDLNSKILKEQFDRYRLGLANLIFTDYLTFHFYKNGVFTTRVDIAKIEHGEIYSLPENFELFLSLIKDFALTISQTIKSPTKLAEMMAGKAKLMADVIEKSLCHDDETNSVSDLKRQMLSFKAYLIHDISNAAYADIYAQTIAYGMFAARYHDPTLPTFSRQEAATLIPKSNPFLRRLFQDIAGYDLDIRLVWIVDELVNIFLATDVAEIMKNFGRNTKQEDPVVHFYETFLAAYNPALRKARGVWYTPQPVVNFIVRAVDDILKADFNLPKGLADTSKIKIKRKHITKATPDRRSINKEVETEVDIHKVQILDPATGTGTFLAEVVKHIYKKFDGQQGIWNNYVDQNLIPRLNGFELLMASYAMAHLKLDMLLTETQYKATKDQRFRVFLTNSLEEASEVTIDLFNQSLSDEANHANFIKLETPVMVIMGNPPYSGESSNKGKWIMKLMEDYKKEPGGIEKLKEQNSKYINDDYVKFIRFSQQFIDKYGEGIMAFINPHGYLDNPTFRGMRWRLLKTYDKIYTIDLHGNSKKKETAPDGSPDQNVFDIMQGVSINLFVKTGLKAEKELSKVYQYDLYGKRNFKYSFLAKNNLEHINFVEVKPFAPNYTFKNLDLEKINLYNKGFSLVKLFPVSVGGFTTHRDNFAIDFDKDEVLKRAIDMKDIRVSDDEIYQKYLISDNRDWKLRKARLTIQKDDNWERKIISSNYRPFDNRYCYFSDVMMDYPRTELIQQTFEKKNILLGIGRQGIAVGDIEWCLVTIAKNPVDANIFRRGGVNLFPLYRYKKETDQISIVSDEQYEPNLNREIIDLLSQELNLKFNASDEIKIEGTFSPLNLLDYIYAVLHSTTYRNEYKEFLKLDFPIIPYPSNSEEFFNLVELGGKLRKLHLLESEETENYITQYPEPGCSDVDKPNFQLNESGDKGKVYINDTQYFDDVPQIAWDFYIGGYQPAQKWLKDRKGRQLDYEEIFHYQKIIVALCRTSEIMKEIDQTLHLILMPKS